MTYTQNGQTYKTEGEKREEARQKAQAERKAQEQKKKEEEAKKRINREADAQQRRYLSWANTSTGQKVLKQSGVWDNQEEEKPIEILYVEDSIRKQTRRATFEETLAYNTKPKIKPYYSNLTSQLPYPMTLRKEVKDYSEFKSSTELDRDTIAGGFNPKSKLTPRVISQNIMMREGELKRKPRGFIDSVFLKFLPDPRDLVINQPEKLNSYFEIQSKLTPSQKRKTAVNTNPINLIFESYSTEQQKRNILAFESGYYQNLYEKPVETVIKTGAFFLAPKVLSIAGRGISAIGTVTGLSKIPAVTKVTGFVSQASGIALTGAYSISVGKRIYDQPKGEARYKEFGRIASSEITPMVVGGVLGSKFWQWQEGLVATAGRKEIPAERLIPKDVLSGKNRFPLSKGRTPAQIRKEQLKLFETQSQRLPDDEFARLFHATGDRGFMKKTFQTTKGSAEFEGLYGSYGVSPNFIRADGSSGKLSDLFGGSLFTPYARPGVAGIRPTGFKAVRPLSMPKGGLAGVKSGTGIQGIVGTQPGVAYIPGYKTEVEAILLPGTNLQRTAQNFFFKYNGVRVPLDQYDALSGIATKGSTTIRNLFASSSYTGLGSYPVFTPASSLTGLISSRSSVSRPSYTSYKSFISSVSRPSSSVSKPSFSSYSIYKSSKSSVSRSSFSSFKRSSYNFKESSLYPFRESSYPKYSPSGSRSSGSKSSFSLPSLSETPPKKEPFYWRFSKFDRIGKTNRKRESRSQAYGYTPSLVGISLKIKGKKSLFGKITGFGIRPISTK